MMLRSISGLALAATLLGACSGAPEGIAPNSVADAEDPRAAAAALGATQPAIASPIVGVTIDELIAYQPQARQQYLSLSGWDGGESKNLDFDDRVGIEEGSQIQSTMAGEIDEVFAFVTPWDSDNRAVTIYVTSTSKSGTEVRQTYLPLSESSVEEALGAPLDELEGMEVEQGQLLGALAPDESPEFSYAVQYDQEYVDPQFFLQFEAYLSAN